LSKRNYPQRWEFPNLLGVTYVDIGQYEEGLKEGEDGARVQANMEPPYRRQWTPTSAWTVLLKPGS
jgi:eukaryotic-like serine/threonine-protein kinase